MRAYFIGYAILIAGYLAGMAYGIDHEVWVLVAAASLFVLLARIFGEVTLLGTILVLFIFNLIMPLIILWAIGIHAEMELAVSKSLEEYDWFRALTPLVSGTLTYFLATPIKTRLSRWGSA